MNVKDYINGLLGDIRFVRADINLRRSQLVKRIALLETELERETDPIEIARKRGMIAGMFEGARVSNGALAYLDLYYPKEKRPRLRLLKKR